MSEEMKQEEQPQAVPVEEPTDCAPTEEQPQAEPSPEEIDMMQRQAEQEAQHNAEIIGRLTIKTAVQLAPLKAKYYKAMHEELMKAGFSDDKAQRIVENLKV